MFLQPPISLPQILVTDFETYSEVNLKIVGIHQYAKHASTEILCCSFGFDEHNVFEWDPSKPVPQFVINHVLSGGILGAHNAEFERLIWNEKLIKFGLPRTPINQWVCTAAQVAALAAPRRLDHAGEFFELDEVKDGDGKKVLNKLSKPDKKGNKPQGTPDEWATLLAYNKQDVVSEIVLKKNTRALQRSERLVWVMDQVINDRGIYVDVPFAKAAKSLWEKHAENINKKFQKLTGLNATQTEAIKNWLSEKGENLWTLRKQSVEDYLDNPVLDPDVRDVLEMRLEAGAAAVKKFQTFITCADSSSRIRGTLRYHAASTGRWGGRLIQPQNMKRPTLKVNQYEPAMELVRKQDIEGIKILYGSVSDTLGSLCRATIQAAPGNKLVASDFSQVEARAVAWFSGQQDLLAAFANDGDPYKFMASKVFGKPPEAFDDDSHERFIGKQLTLGCFGADTLVLTDDGWKPIVDVQVSDKVWDGVEWVSHLGVLYQGKKTVLKRHKVFATPDHLCLTPNGWQKWESVTTHQNIKTATGLVSLPLKAIDGFCLTRKMVRLDRLTGTKQNAVVGMYHYVGGQTLTKDVPHVATDARKLQLRKNSTGSTLKQCHATSTELDYLTGYQQQSLGVTRNQQATTTVMVEGVSKSAKSGLTTGQVSLLTSKRYRVGITRILKWTGKTTTKAMSRETYASQRASKMHLTGERSKVCSVSYKLQTGGLKNLNKRMNVYDIRNAGPRNRFTILTEAGPLIVHNCGYQLGGDKFHRSLKEQFGVDVGRENAVSYIKLYREANKNIVQYWYNLQREVINTVKTGRSRMFGPLGMRMVGKDWLFITLPSGRDLAYYKPQITQDQYGDKLSFYGVDNKSGRGIKEDTYGGKLLENICSGFCRDLMVEAVLRLEHNYYPVVLTVHDEVISEVPEWYGGAKEMNQIMTVVPPWAKGFPLASKSWEGLFYRK